MCVVQSVCFPPVVEAFPVMFRAGEATFSVQTWRLRLRMLIDYPGSKLKVLADPKSDVIPALPTQCHKGV